mgnify:CR=1 FL=1
MMPKGMIKAIRKKYPTANIVAVDYDAGATKINQENRIKLMLSNARANAKKEEAEKYLELFSQKLSILIYIVFS